MYVCMYVCMYFHVSLMGKSVPNEFFSFICMGVYEFMFWTQEMKIEAEGCKDTCMYVDI